MEGQMSIFDLIDEYKEETVLTNERTNERLILGDCSEELKKIPDNSVDLVVIDPPYEFVDASGAGTFGNKRGKAGLNNDYHDEYLTVYRERTEMGKRKKRNLEEMRHITYGFDFSVLDELCRVEKKINIYVWCSKQQVNKILNYFVDRNCYIDILTWHKTNPVPTCNGTYLNDTEYCIFAREKGVKVYGTFETKRKWYLTPLNVKDKRKYNHPTIKPVHIIENLIINSSLEGDTVLDCFMGSGTTGVASKKLGRNFIGIEVNDDYFKIAEERINDTGADEYL